MKKNKDEKIIQGTEIQQRFIMKRKGVRRVTLEFPYDFDIKEDIKNSIESCRWDRENRRWEVCDLTEKTMRQIKEFAERNKFIIDEEVIKCFQRRERFLHDKQEDINRKNIINIRNFKRKEKEAEHL